MKNSLEELKDLIDNISSVYYYFTDIWSKRTSEQINLKKTCISDIDINSDVYQYIMEYVKMLNAKSANVSFLFSNSCSLQVTARVKSQNSIEIKMQNYKTEKHAFGKIPINKCFNDLFGVRVILEDLLTFNEIQTFIKTTYKDKYKCINSSKFEYKAVHLYFRENNYSFPWELQIWNKEDAACNLISHKKYKQKYTIWEQERKKGEIEE